jgi:Fe2+ transport system protein B
LSELEDSSTELEEEEELEESEDEESEDDEIEEEEEESDDELESEAELLEPQEETQAIAKKSAPEKKLEEEITEENEEETEEESKEENSEEEEPEEAAHLDEGDHVLLPQLVNFLTPIILLYAIFFLVGIFYEGFFPIIYASLISLAGLLLFSSKTSYKKLLSHLNFRLLWAIFLLCFIACIISVLLLVSNFLML